MGGDMSTISASTTTTTAFGVTADTTGALVLQTGATPTTAVTIDTSQNVGIGTTSPSSKLHVGGAGSTYISVTSSNAGSGTGLYTSNATSAYYIGAGAASGGSSLEFRDSTNSSTRMIIDSSGNLALTGGGQLRSNATNTPVTFADSAGTQVGTLCRAWVNFNSSGTIAASFNVSSVTKVTTAVFTVTFTTAFPDAKYAYSSGTAGNSTGAGGGWSLTAYDSSTYLAGSVKFTSGVSNGNYDVTYGPLTLCFFR